MENRQALLSSRRQMPACYRSRLKRYLSDWSSRGIQLGSPRANRPSDGRRLCGIGRVRVAARMICQGALFINFRQIPRLSPLLPLFQIIRNVFDGDVDTFVGLFL